jgi:hypothetical protein
MKTSTKIVITLSAALLVAFLVGLLLVRNDLKHFLVESERERYKTMTVDTFQSIQLSSKWDVKIRQAKQFKVMLDIRDTIYNPVIHNVNGTLRLQIDSTFWKNNGPYVHARITLPDLRGISAEGNTRINIEDFKSDSLSITIDDGCTFTGRENTFEKVFFESRGDARIELTDRPDI